jgi:hypothetical protein
MGVSAARLELIISIESAPIHNVNKSDWLFSNQLPSYVIYIGVWTLFQKRHLAIRASYSNVLHFLHAAEIERKMGVE